MTKLSELVHVYLAGAIAGAVLLGYGYGLGLADKDSVVIYTLVAFFVLATGAIVSAVVHAVVLRATASWAVFSKPPTP